MIKKYAPLVILLFIFTGSNAQSLEEVNFSTMTTNINTHLTDINNAGFVTGYYDSAGVSIGFVINPEGKIKRFFGAGSNITKVEGINEHNVVAIGLTSGGNTIVYKAYYDSVAQDYGTPVAVSGITYPNVNPLGINNNNDISGWYPNLTDRWLWVNKDSVSPAYNAQRYYTGIWPSYTYYPTYAGGINDAGKVCGFYIDGGLYYPFVFDNGSNNFTVLTGGLNKTKPWGINNNNRIVGEYHAANGFWTAFYGQVSGTTITPTSLAPIFQTAAMQSVANGVNDKGEIVGAYLHPNTGTWVGFIYRPQVNEYRLPGYDWTKHTWNMVNATTPIPGYPAVWTTNYYGNFDYRITDPFANVNTPPVLDSFMLSTLPGTGKPAITGISAVISEAATEIDTSGNVAAKTNYQVWKHWAATKWANSFNYANVFNGICYGFAFTSALKYYNDTLLQQFGIPATTDLSTFTNTNSNEITAITRVYLKQFDMAKMTPFLPSTMALVKPWVGLYRLKNTYMDTDPIRRDPRAIYISFKPPVGGYHSIFPYKIRTPKKFPFTYNNVPSYDTLFIYDSNHPQDSLQYFTVKSTTIHMPIDSVKNATYTTLWQIAFNEAGVKEMIAVKHSVLKTTSYQLDTAISVAINPSLYYTISASGNAATFDASGSNNTIPFLNAAEQKDIGAIKPRFYNMDTSNNINVKSYNYTDNSMAWNINSAHKSMGITRDALLAEEDFGTWNHRMMSYGTHDIATKTLSCYFMEMDDGLVQGVNILASDITMNNGDSLLTLNPDRFIYKIVRFGTTADTYDVWVYTAGADSMRTYKIDDVIMNGGASHTITTYYGPTGKQTVILVDEGNNGSVDDTLVVAYVPLSLFEPMQDQIRVYPNPASDRVTIYWGGHSQAYSKIVITDLMGKKMDELVPNTADQQVHVNLGGYPAGMYMVRVFDKDGRAIYTNKFVKN